jgi:hypothetical protein
MLIVLCVTLMAAQTAFAAWVDPALESSCARRGRKRIDVFITLDDQVDLVALVAELQAQRASLGRRHY